MDTVIKTQLEIQKRENEKLKKQIEEMSIQNSKLKQICQFFAEENIEINEKYNKLLTKLKD